MSASDRQMIARYVASAGDGESRWIRLEQERDDDELVTLEQAAEFFDALYDIDSCEQGVSGGGEEASNEPPPLDKFAAAAAALLGDKTCAEAEYWTAVVRVYRSHQTPAYTLRSATATVASTEAGVRESVREIVENAGASHDLEYPYAGDLILPPGVTGTVRGSTLNLSRPAGRLVIRYTTVYDRVTLHVPVTAESESVGVGDEERALRAALDAAGLVVFQGRGATGVAAACALKPPEHDDSLSAMDLMRLCGAKYKGKPREGECWQTIKHYRRCTCSAAVADGSGWREDVAAPCPPGVLSGSHVDVVLRFSGYVWCPGEIDEDITDPEYYKRVCCVPPKKPLPNCRRYYSLYRGGAAIESGADYWRSAYGEDVRLVAVAPSDGICGTHIKEWNVEQQNCCDDVPPLRPDPDNPTAIYAGDEKWICTLDGKPGRHVWQASGGLVFVGAGGDGQEIVTGGASPDCVLVGTREEVCPHPLITVNDGCTRLEMQFEGGSPSPPMLSEEDTAVQPRTRFTLLVAGGVPPYRWSAESGVEIIRVDQRGVLLETGDRLAWCVARITVTDACGQTAECTVRNAATGSWVQLADGTFDQCDPPAPGGAQLNATVQGSSWLEPRGGYQLYIAVQEKSVKKQLVCPVGTNMSSNGAELKRARCNGGRCNSGYTGQYSDGDCSCVRKSDGYTVHFYYADFLVAVRKWICV